jgi:serine/threonine-protein kinase
VNQPLGSRYVLEEPLGRGASGTVWRGRVRDSGEAVAVKVLREELAGDPDVVTRFLRERALLLRLRHPNLVGVRDLVVEGDVLALVMDLIEGPDLRQHLRAEGKLPPPEAARLLSGVLDALAVTHASGIVHRDLKPANILLRRTAEGFEPLLSDFGIARLADGPQLTRTHELLGTPSYVAPETAAGARPTPAVDVYAAGILLYELVSGAPPFTDDSPFVVLRKHIEETPTRPAEMPELLWLLVGDCLRKDPAERPETRTLARRLRRVGEVLSGTAGEGLILDPGGSDNGPGATRSLDALRTQQLRSGPHTQPPMGPPMGPPMPAPGPPPLKPTLVESAPPTRQFQPQQAPPPRQAVRPQQPAQARPQPPPQAPPRGYAAAPPPQQAPPGPDRTRRPRPAPGPAPEPPRPPKGKRPRRRLLPRIPGMGCLMRLAFLAAILAGVYHFYLRDTAVGELIHTVVTETPILIDKAQNLLDRLQGS